LSAWANYGRRCVRSDGAVVKWDDSSPHPNPAQPTARMWTAFEPDPSQKYLAMHRGRTRKAQDGHMFKPGFPRRWKTAEAAMRAVDKEFPMRRGVPVANKEGQ
jgi:hypothetical protein